MAEPSWFTRDGKEERTPFIGQSGPILCRKRSLCKGGCDQLHSATNGFANSFKKNSRPANVGIYVLGIQGLGSWCRVMRRDRRCHCMPRPKAPAAPPIILSAA